MVFIVIIKVITFIYNNMFPVWKTKLYGAFPTYTIQRHSQAFVQSCSKPL